MESVVRRHFASLVRQAADRKKQGSYRRPSCPFDTMTRLRLLVVRAVRDLNFRHINGFRKRQHPRT